MKNHKKFQEIKKFFYKNYHRYQGQIKHQAVQEIVDVLEDQKTLENPTEAIINCQEQLRKGETLTILEINRQSLGERIAKGFSIAAIIPALILALKRLYDTRWNHWNFFKPLTKNLHEDIEKKIASVKLSQNSLGSN